MNGDEMKKDYVDYFQLIKEKISAAEGMLNGARETLEVLEKIGKEYPEVIEEANKYANDEEIENENVNYEIAEKETITEHGSSPNADWNMTQAEFKDYQVSFVKDKATRICEKILAGTIPLNFSKINNEGMVTKIDKTLSKLSEKNFDEVCVQFDVSDEEMYDMLETLVKAKDYFNGNYDCIRPNAAQIKVGLQNGWSFKEALCGYIEMADGVNGATVMDRIDVMNTFDSFMKATHQAEIDGVKFIPDEELEIPEDLENVDSFYTSTEGFHYRYLDKPENRELLKDFIGIPRNWSIHIDDPKRQHEKKEIEVSLKVYEGSNLKNEVEKGNHLVNDNEWVGFYKVSDSLIFNIVTGTYDGKTIIDLRPEAITPVFNVLGLHGNGIINDEDVSIEVLDEGGPSVNLDSHWITYDWNDLKDLSSKQLEEKFLNDIEAAINKSKILPSLALNYGDMNRLPQEGADSIVIEDAEWGDVLVVKHGHYNGESGWYYGLFNQHMDISNVEDNLTFYTDEQIQDNFKELKKTEDITVLDIARQILIDHQDYGWQRTDSEKSFSEQWLNQNGTELSLKEQHEYLKKLDEHLLLKFGENLKELEEELDIVRLNNEVTELDYSAGNAAADKLNELLQNNGFKSDEGISRTLLKFATNMNDGNFKFGYDNNDNIYFDTELDKQGWNKDSVEGIVNMAIIHAIEWGEFDEDLLDLKKFLDDNPSFVKDKAETLKKNSITYNEIEEFHKQSSKLSEEYFHTDINSTPKEIWTDRVIEVLWNELENVPFREDADGHLLLDTDKAWFGFQPGTDREEIWHFIDERHSKGLVYLMDEYEPENIKSFAYDYSDFTETDFERLKFQLKEMNKDSVPGFGRIKVGSIDIDISVRNYGSATNPYFKLDFDYYILGKDTGYGETKNGIPYSHEDGTGVRLEFLESLGYEEFKKVIEETVLHDKTLLHVQDAEKTIADWNMTSDDYKNYQALNDVRKRFDSKIIADFEESEDYEITERLNNFEEIKAFVSNETVEKIREHFKGFDNPNPSENTCYANIIYNSRTKTCHAEIHDEDMMIEDVNGAELKFDKEMIEKCEQSLEGYKINIQKEKPVIENLEPLDYERYVNAHLPPMVKSFDSNHIEDLKSYNEQAGDIMLYDKENDKLYRLYESDKNGFENTKDTDLLHASNLDDMLRFAVSEALDGNMGRNENDPMFEVNEEAGKFFSAKLEEFEVANIVDNFVQSLTGSTRDELYSPDESHECRFYCDFNPSVLGFNDSLESEDTTYRVGMVFNKGQECVDYFIDRIKDGNIEYDVQSELKDAFKDAFNLAEESVRRWTIQNNEKDFPIVINYAFPEKTSDSYNDIRHSFNEVYKNEENKPVVTIYEEPRWSYQDKTKILNLIQKFDKDIYQEIEEFKERWELINDDLYIDLGKSIRYDDGDGLCGDWSEDVLKELESNYFTVRFSSEHYDGNLDNPFEMEVDSETAKKLNSMIEDHVKSNQEKFIEFKNKRNDLISKELSSFSMNLDAVDELTLKEISKQGFHVLTKKNPENELVRLQRPQLTVELENLLNLSKTDWHKGEKIEDVNYGFYREFEIGKNGNVVNKSEIKVWKDFVDANEKTVDLAGTNDPLDFFVKSEDAKRMVNDFFEKGINDYIRERNPEVAFKQDLIKDILDNCVLGHSVEEHNEVGSKVEKNTFIYKVNDEIAKKLGLDLVSDENPDIKYHYEVRAAYLTQNGTSKLRFDKTEFDFVSLATDYSNDKVHGEALDDKTVIFPLSDYAASMGEDTVSLIKNRIEDKAAELTDSKEILALERGEEVHFSVEELEPAQVDDILLFYAKESKNDRTLSVDLANEIIRITDEDNSSLYVDPAGRICMQNDEGGVYVFTPEHLYEQIQEHFTNELEGGAGTLSYLEQEEIDKYMKEFDDFYDEEMSEHSYSYLFPEHFFKHISELDNYNLTYKGTYLFPQEGECQIVEGAKAELEKIADDYGYELHPDFVYRTDDLSTDYAEEVPDLSKPAASREPKDIIMNIDDGKSIPKNFNVRETFRRELLDGMKTNQDPFKVTKEIFGRWYNENREKGDLLNDYFKERGCGNPEDLKRILMEEMGFNPETKKCRHSNHNKNYNGISD